VTFQSDRFLLWIAQGFGSGRLRPGPGTWGSLVGLALSYPLLKLPVLAQAAIAVALAILAVPVCAAGERILGRKDPGSVVFDEIVAMPLVFLPASAYWHSQPPPNDVHVAWPVWVAGFLLFRVLDIWKPWPIRSLQNLHGGLGVVVDDIAAALIAGGVLVPLSILLPRF
jgi:phosphatidylglycerophosphatase A